ncbi:hypothetical protein Nocox_22810 [Nonomuraea coxensis DSM 45129]|uniref:Uncharacterized protein n=2 Tax=Nonomuraea coxensis TaxID=404386 RepID=A0ABX8U5J8_9ACTN|nr:hypothetical protein Nocox_22810 [Nonomuraea coxensis DSM 45129]
MGGMDRSRESLQPPGDPDQTLCVYNVESGSATEQALRLLAGWTAPSLPGHELSYESTM